MNAVNKHCKNLLNLGFLFRARILSKFIKRRVWYHPKSDQFSWLSIAEVFLNVPSLLGGIPVFTGSIKLRFLYFEHITLNKISNKKKNLY